MSKKKLEPLDEVISVPHDASIYEAAERMKREAVGCLVVESDEHLPIGIVTDRDLTLRVVAWPVDVKATPISQVMSSPVECVLEDEDRSGALNRMCALGVRRIPITRDGRAIGLVSLDDLTERLSADMGSLSLGTAGKLARARRSEHREEIAREAEALLKELGSRLRRANWYTRKHFLAELDEVREKVDKALKGKAL